MRPAPALGVIENDVRRDEYQLRMNISPKDGFRDMQARISTLFLP